MSSSSSSNHPFLEGNGIIFQPTIKFLRGYSLVFRLGKREFSNFLEAWPLSYASTTMENGKIQTPTFRSCFFQTKIWQLRAIDLGVVDPPFIFFGGEGKGNSFLYPQNIKILTCFFLKEIDLNRLFWESTIHESTPSRSFEQLDPKKGSA